MTQIKSAKAKSHIEKWQWQSKGGTFDNSPIILRSIAAEGIVIAEQEAEERHAKELEAVELKTIEVYKRNCRNYTACCFDKNPCTADCEYLADFIQKLNER